MGIGVRNNMLLCVLSVTTEYPLNKMWNMEIPPPI